MIRWEFGLEAAGGVSRHLIQRLISDGQKEEATWRRIATFESYNDAEHVLTLIRKALVGI